MAVSISQVYNSVKDIVNKEQKGFITPTAFNSLATIAQMKIFNELMNEFVDARKVSRQNLETKNHTSFIRRKQEDLATFITTADINILNTFNGTYEKPLNVVKIISISEENATGDEDITKDYDIELIHDPELFNHIIKSYLSSPTGNYKVAMVDGSNIIVSPATSNTLTIKYYRRPGSVDLNGVFSDFDPQYSVSLIDGIEIQDQNSRDFMLPPHYAPELVAEICEMVGVRLRDNNVQAFGQQKSAEQ